MRLYLPEEPTNKLYAIFYIQIWHKHFNKLVYYSNIFEICLFFAYIGKASDLYILLGNRMWFIIKQQLCRFILYASVDFVFIFIWKTKVRVYRAVFYVLYWR